MRIFMLMLFMAVFGLAGICEVDGERRAGSSHGDAEDKDEKMRQAMKAATPSDEALRGRRG